MGNIKEKKKNTPITSTQREEGAYSKYAIPLKRMPPSTPNNKTQAILDSARHMTEKKKGLFFKIFSNSILFISLFLKKASYFVHKL